MTKYYVVSENQLLDLVLKTQNAMKSMATGEVTEQDKAMHLQIFECRQIEVHADVGLFGLTVYKPFKYFIKDDDHKTPDGERIANKWREMEQPE